jgi:EmrB/QacA subfamily drug resistance transporter
VTETTRTAHPTTSSPEVPSKPTPQTGGLWLTILLTSVAYFMVTLDGTIVVTALPAIHRDLGGNASTLQWMVNAYNIAFATGIITATALGDRLGRRRVYLGGLALFTASSGACALAPSTSALVGFRIAQGVGAAIILPLGLTLLTSQFPSDRRGRIIGVWGGIAGAAVAAGPLVGGAVTQGLSWRWIFWINVPIGFIASIGSRIRLTESYGPRRGIDAGGIVLSGGGVGLFISALVRASTAGWGGVGTNGGIAAGLLLLVAFLAWERRSSHPMVPLHLFRSRTFSAAIAANFFTAAAIFSGPVLLSELFQIAQHDDPFGAGLRFLPLTATPLVVAPIAGLLTDRVGARRLAAPGLIAMAAGFGWLVHLANTHTGYASYVPPLLIAGIGVSMALPSLPAAGLNAVPSEALGQASGVLNMTQRLGAAIGIAITTVVFNANGSLTAPADFIRGFGPALAVAAGLSALGAVTALAIKRGQQPDIRAD